MRKDRPRPLLRSPPGLRHARPTHNPDCRTADPGERRRDASSPWTPRCPRSGPFRPGRPEPCTRYRRFLSRRFQGVDGSAARCRRGFESHSASNCCAPSTDEQRVPRRRTGHCFGRVGPTGPCVRTREERRFVGPAPRLSSTDSPRPVAKNFYRQREIWLPPIVVVKHRRTRIASRASIADARYSTQTTVEGRAVDVGGDRPRAESTAGSAPLTPRCRGRCWRGSTLNWSEPIATEERNRKSPRITLYFAHRSESCCCGPSSSPRGRPAAATGTTNTDSVRDISWLIPSLVFSTAVPTWLTTPRS